MTSTSAIVTTSKFGQHQIELIKTTLMVAKDAPPPTNDELALFLAICDRMSLDPFAKQIYPVYRKGKWTVQIGVDGLRAIADRTGQYAGSDEPLYDEGLDVFAFEQSGRKIPTVCKVTVWKIVAGVRCPFVGVAKYREYVQIFNNKTVKLWEDMPLNQLAKCAESQALRKAFPQCNNAHAAVQVAPEVAPEDTRSQFIQAIEAEVIEASLTLSKEQHDYLEGLRKERKISSEAYRNFIQERYGATQNSKVPAHCFEELANSMSSEAWPNV